MSILEKYKLVEKDESTSLPTESNIDENTSVTSSETTSPPLPPEENPEEEKQQVEQLAEEDVITSVESVKELPPMPKHTQKDTLNETSQDLTAAAATTVQGALEESTLYNRNISIDEVYSQYSLGDISPTETVFLLENLINALPAELPEFVKKTTIDNIAKASAIDVDKLLTDGERRNANLNRFINDFTTSNLNEIANLKQEIEKLSALIADYHQQIKHKELLIHEETTLVTDESQRINNILEFFKK